MERIAGSDDRRRLHQSARPSAQHRSRSFNVSISQAAQDTREPTTPTVASTVDALAAVIPAGIAGLYTLVVVPMQQYSLKAAADEKGTQAAALAAEGVSAAEIQGQLAARAQESSDWLALRWGVLVFAAVVELVLAGRAVGDGNRASQQRR
jgi:hypothetical protein